MDLKSEIGEDKKQTPLELLNGNAWVFDNPILLAIVEYSLSPTEADRLVTKRFHGLDTVNKIARAVRKITMLKAKVDKQTWETFQQRSENYRLSDIFVFPQAIDGFVEEPVFSSGINFYFPEHKGFVSYFDIPDVLQEIAVGQGITSVGYDSKDCCFWEETMNNCLKPTLMTKEEVIAKKGNFDITFGKGKKQSNDLRPCWMMYSNNNLSIVNQIVMVKPFATKKHAKVYRKISFFAECDKYEESIVILFDLGVVPSVEQRFPVGRVVFRKECMFKGDIKLCLSFDLTILSDLSLVPTYALRNFQIPAFITLEGRYKNIGDQSCKDIDLNDCQEIFAGLFADYKRINPYGKKKNLSIFNSVLMNPPQQLINLFE